MKSTVDRPSNVAYAQARLHHALVRREPARGLVAVLLRPDEPGATHDALRAIGFAPEFTTDDASSTWVGDLGRDLALLHDALGPDALFDLGPVFHDVQQSLATAPAGWPGRFVLHVGGTQRCLVFDDPTRDDLEPVLRREIDDYFVKEWSPSRE